jgi:NADH-quinone oxidoreductase subunit A
VAKAVRVRVSPTAPNTGIDSAVHALAWLCQPMALTVSNLSVSTKMNLEQYLPVLLFILVGVAVGVVPQVLGRLLGPHRPDSEKNSPYECGFEAFEDARMKFDVRYYLVAILFIIFDLEIAFLFPWAVALKEIGIVGFWAMMIFLGILVVGFIYEWKKGALDWE